MFQEEENIDQESEEIQLAIAISETLYKDNLKENIEDIFEEEDIQVALAMSQSQDNEGNLQEEEQFQLALALSVTLDEESNDHTGLGQRQEPYSPTADISGEDLLFRDGVQVALPIPNTETTSEETSSSSGLSSTESEDYESEVPDEYEGEAAESLSSEGTFYSELPEIYMNYRLIPIMFTEEYMWPLSAINQQLSELRVGRANEEVKVWQESQCENERCLVCLTNVATRVAVPCGHRLGCRICVSELIDKKLNYSVISPNGHTYTTNYRLPIQCFTCRAIIGQIITVH